jgi:hypothetical protein
MAPAPIVTVADDHAHAVMVAGSYIERIRLSRRACQGAEAESGADSRYLHDLQHGLSPGQNDAPNILAEAMTGEWSRVPERRGNPSFMDGSGWNRHPMAHENAQPKAPRQA